MRGRQTPADAVQAERAVDTARRAALGALADWPAAQPIPGITMNSGGRLLIIGETGLALGWADKLHDKLELTVLATENAAAIEAPARHRYSLLIGQAVRLSGHLGAFELEWQTAAGDAIPGKLVTESFDLVLDLSATPLLRMTELPDGYQAPGPDPLDQALAVIELLPLTGEFEKPQYVALRQNLCAHSRAKLSGCDKCIEVCASAAIVAQGDTVQVDPYLCQGCGTCASVCPSGALSYQYPRVADIGARMRAMLAAYREAGGADACLLFHSATAGRDLLARAETRAGGLPAPVLALETWSAEAVGLDLMLAAIALGAGRVAILGAGSHDLTPLRQQAQIAATILGGLGYGGEHVRVLEQSEPEALLGELRDWPTAQGVASAASFCPLGDKRGTLDLAIAHLHAQAPLPQQLVALPAGAPFGSVAASEACTLCMGCVGSCPASALVGGTEAPTLSFIEHNCVQCGLCLQSCPENALTLTPRLLFEGARRERLLRQAEIFRCTSCGKPMGARPLIEAMVSRLSGHSMFAGADALARLKMCGDCRVIDLVRNEDSIHASEMNP